MSIASNDYAHDAYHDAYHTPKQLITNNTKLSLLWKCCFFIVDAIWASSGIPEGLLLAKVKGINIYSGDISSVKAEFTDQVKVQNNGTFFEMYCYHSLLISSRIVSKIRL